MRDAQAATGQQPREPLRCKCGDLEPVHVLSETTGKRGKCSSSACGCREFRVDENGKPCGCGVAS